MVVVLMAPAVQKELNLTEDQKTKVFELAREASQRSREFFQAALRSGGANPQALLAAGMRLRQENERAALKLLEPKQKDRAEQILLRVEGPIAVARPELAEKLNLNPTQVRQVQMTVLQMMQAQREMAQNAGFGAGDGSPSPSRSGATELRMAAGRQVGRILDAKQKAAFTKLLGEPFDISKIDPALPAPSASAGDDKAEPTDRTEKTTKTRARRKRGTPGAKDAAPKDAPAKDSGSGSTP
jgi:hypothetical protein